jgi:dTDP-4-dehydrorhamnose reductase
MKRVLVTGANGQLGQAIQAAAANYPELSFIFEGKETLDVTNEEEVSGFFAKHKIDVCINAAAYTNVDKAENDKEAAYLLNETGPRLLAAACKEHNAFLIHISTDYVFDGTKGSAYTVYDTPNPISIYGASKFAGEKAIAEVGGNYSIVRTSWLYSEYGNNFQTKIVEKSKTAPYLEVVSDLYGTPTYAPNLVVFLLNKIINSTFASNMEHYSGGKSMSWYDLAKQLTATEIRKKAAIKLKLNAMRPKNTTLLNN